MIQNITIKQNFIITSHISSKKIEPTLLEMHNIAREKAQIPPLIENDQLKEAAQKHAKWMADQDTVRHQNLKPLLGNPWRIVAENIAAYYKNNEEVMRGWLNSGGHKDNILNPKFTHLGISVEKRGKKNYWCCIFAGKKS